MVYLKRSLKCKHTILFRYFIIYNLFILFLYFSHLTNIIIIIIKLFMCVLEYK